MGWVHCDVKPNNILFDNLDKSALSMETLFESSNLNLHLIDYGLCQRFLD